MKMIKQVKIFRDLVGEDEADKEKRVNDFLKEIYDDLDVLENFVTNEGEVIIIAHYFISEKPKLTEVSQK